MAKEKVAKTPNYTVEQTADLVKRYQAGESVDDLAAAFNKPKRSIISKLSREGVYKAPEKGTAATSKADGPTKAELMAEIARRVPGFSGEVLEGLANATKAALTGLRDALPEPVEAEVEQTEAAAEAA